MTDQHQLDLIRPRGVEREVTDAEVHALISVLRLAGWVKAHVLSERLGWPDRKIRAAARASKGHILSYPGSPGYKLTIEATVEEIKQAAALKHQADDMLHRFLQIERVYHSKQPLPESPPAPAGQP
jgi:hypothetical protein